MKKLPAVEAEDCLRPREPLPIRCAVDIKKKNLFHAKLCVNKKCNLESLLPLYFVESSWFDGSVLLFELLLRPASWPRCSRRVRKGSKRKIKLPSPSSNRWLHRSSSSVKTDPLETLLIGSHKLRFVWEQFLLNLIIPKSNYL